MDNVNKRIRTITPYASISITHTLWFTYINSQ